VASAGPSRFRQCSYFAGGILAHIITAAFGATPSSFTTPMIVRQWRDRWCAGAAGAVAAGARAFSADSFLPHPQAGAAQHCGRGINRQQFFRFHIVATSSRNLQLTQMELLSWPPRPALPDAFTPEGALPWSARAAPSRATPPLLFRGELEDVITSSLSDPYHSLGTKVE